MNVEIGTETPIFLLWEYLVRNFGILSLQCGTEMSEYSQLLSYSLFSPSVTGSILPVFALQVELFEQRRHYRVGVLKSCSLYGSSFKMIMRSAVPHYSSKIPSPVCLSL
jgi:hypothetical protein